MNTKTQIQKLRTFVLVAANYTIHKYSLFTKVFFGNCCSLKSISFPLFIGLLWCPLLSQWNFFAIEFNQNEYSQDPKVNHCLSQEALDKRKALKINIDRFDVDVFPKYIEIMRNEGFSVVYKSRWLNTIVVATKQSNIPSLAIIKKFWLIDTMSAGQWIVEKDTTIESGRILTKNLNKKNAYGASSGITKFLGLKGLHDAGFTGKGVNVVVFDGGFSNVQKLSIFDTMKSDQRLWFYQDFSQNKRNIFKAGQHGTQVLSCMAAYSPGTYIGTGYGAKYGIIATETGRFESPLEEWAWIQGLEEANQLGADIIQSSLGYTRFDHSEFDHQEDQLSRSEWPIFKAAKMAAQKGMVLINSAGNEGNGNWKYVGFPSGAEDVIAVAAAFTNGEIANFSSYGYPSGFLKPNVAAIGVQTPCISSSGYIVNATGTSFAAPCLAGAMTCLMQLYPNQNTRFYTQILRAISSHSLKHSDRSGYGIPDFSLALKYSNPESKMPFYSNQSNLDTLYPGQEIKTFRKPSKKYKISLINTEGTKYTQNFDAINILFAGVKMDELPSGNYELIIRQGLRKWKKNIYFTRPNIN